MKNSTEITINQINDKKALAPTGGLLVRTGLRAGLAWDDLDDKAQELWGSLTSSLSSLTGGVEASRQLR